MSKNNSSAQDQLMYTAVLQCVAIGICIVVGFVVVKPKLEVISAQTATTNQTIASYNTMADQGIAPNALAAAVGNSNAKLVEIIKSNGDAVKEVIKKQGTQPYLDWLKGEVNNKSAYETQIKEARDKINTILPTLSPVNNGISENNISLLDYVEFIETRILKDHDIQSTSALGINGITYNKADSGSTNPIGYFDTTISFKGSNRSIASLLDYIYKSGDPSILVSSGETINYDALYASGKLSNPLMVVQSFSLKEMLDTKIAPFQENEGQMTLRMYLRGASTTDKDNLVAAFNDKKSTLEKQITEALSACQNSGCLGRTQLEGINKKFSEFVRSVSDEKLKGTGVESFYYASQQLQSLSAIEADFNRINQ